MSSSVSKAQICNMALSHIHSTETTIANLVTDTGNVATQCRIHYDVSRRFVLADREWNFATRRVTLSDIGSPPNTWDYRYDMPSEAVKFQSIQRALRTDPPIKFKVENDGSTSGSCVLTDEASAIGVYTWDCEETGLFSPGFVSAFSWYLASELAPALTGDREIQQFCLSIYSDRKSSASTHNSQEAQEDDELDAPWILARG